jgi:NADH pyrophosphatase NudC (nudix superfamily)
MASCTTCQHDNRSGAKFCVTCGSPIPEEQALVLARCAKTKEFFVLRFVYRHETTGEGWLADTVYPITPEAAARGGYGAVQITGAISANVACPGCGRTSYYEAHERMSCCQAGYSGPAACGWCKEKHHIGKFPMRKANAVRDL